MDHLFVIGCERSGTTPLTRLLGSHDQVALGMERYKFVLRQMRHSRSRHLLGPRHFEPGRFLDFRPGDTNLVPPQFEAYYAQVAARFAAGTVALAGDKVLPPDTFTTLALAEAFPQARFVFVFRDLLRVASSFSVRAADDRDPDWAPHHDHQVAVAHWHESFAAADAVVARLGLDRVFLVQPDRLYGPDDSTCRSLFAFLGLEMTADTVAYHAMLTRKWLARQDKPLVLDAEVQRSLLDQVDQARLARYEDWARRQLEPREPGWGGRRQRRRWAQARDAFEAAATRAWLEADEQDRQTRLRDHAWRRDRRRAGPADAS